MAFAQRLDFAGFALEARQTTQGLENLTALCVAAAPADMEIAFGVVFMEHFIRVLAAIPAGSARDDIADELVAHIQASAHLVADRPCRAFLSG